MNQQSTSTIARGYLWLCAIFFIGLALALLFRPAEILKNVEIVPLTTTAYSDLRADYGGCLFGVGLFLVYCALKPSSVRFGLVCTGLTLWGYALGRLLSLLLDGVPKRIIFILLGIELLMGGLALVLARFPKEIESKSLVGD